MRVVSIIITILFFQASLFSQVFIMDAGTNNTTVELTNCAGGLFDSGGAAAIQDYQNGENYTITICPPAGSGDFISLYWTIFDLSTFNDGTQQNPNLDYITIWDGDDNTAPTLGTYSGDALANLTVSATNLNPTGCLTIQFTSNSSGTGNFSASVSCETPCSNPTVSAEILNGITTDSIRVCVGDPVTFQDNGSFAAPGFTLDGTYHWQFGSDGTDTTSGATATHSFSQPGEFIVQLTVTDDNGCSNLNLADLQVLVSTYPTFDLFPADTTLCIGESMTATAFPDLYPQTWTGFPTGFTSDDCDTMAMQDDVGVLNGLQIPMSGFNPGETIDNINDIVNISVDIEHSFMGDFVLQIMCPNGQIATLHQQGGGGTDLGDAVGGTIDCDDATTIGDPFTYTFSENAAETWVDWTNNNTGNQLPAGDYQPVGTLTDLIGCPLNGVWTLLFTDNWGGDDGYIPTWTINFDPPLYPDITEFTPSIGADSDSSYWDLAGTDIVSNSPDINTIDIVPTAAGSFDYTYFVTNDFGCEFDSSFTITVTDNPLADAGMDTSICGGGTQVQLQGGVSGGAPTCDYTLILVDDWPDSWNGNMVDITINGGTPTSYTVDFAQDDSATYVLSVSHGDQIDIQYDDGGSFQSENEIYIFDGAGNLVYSDGQNGATPTTALQSITADCYSNLDISWSPDNGTLSDINIFDPVATPNGAQEYILTVAVDGHPLCFTTDTVNINVGGASDSGNDSTAYFCADGTPEDLFNYIGGTPQTTGTWQEAGTGNPVTMPFDPATMIAGDYEYHVDSAGCTSFSTITVVIVEPTSSNVTVDSDCGACNGEVTLTGANGLGATYEFSIDNGATYQAGATFNGLCPGDYYFVVRDSLGCTVNDTATILEIGAPTISFDDTTSTDCGGATGDISVNTSLGSAPFQFGIVGGVLQADSTISGLTTGTYDIVAVDNFGCSDTLFGVVIDSINIPNINLVDPTDATCNSADDGMVDISGDHITNFSINGGAFQATGNFTSLAPGNYTVLVENDFGCQDTSSFVIIQPLPLAIQLTSTVDSICAGQTATVSVSGSGGNGGPYTFDWYESGTMIDQGASIDVSPAVSNLTYCAVISEACGSPTDSVCTTVVVEDPPVLSFSADVLSGCYPIDVEFTNTTTGNIANSAWYFGDGQSTQTAGTNSVIHTYDSEGLFDVTLEVTTASGCTYDKTYASYIEAFGYPIANMTFSPNPVSMYEPEVTFQDISTGDDIVSWIWAMPGGLPSSSVDQNPSTVYPEGEPGVYDVYLTVTNANGCIDSSSTQVIVTNEVLFYAPTAFTPDGDEFNEIWRIHIEGIDFYDFSLVMFNRWGERVWENRNPDVGWNGRYMGNLVQDGTYVWVVECKDQWNDKKYTFRGHVTVIR